MTFLANRSAANRLGLAISLLSWICFLLPNFPQLRHHFILIKILINTYLCTLGLLWEAACALSFGDYRDPLALLDSNLTHHRTTSYIPLLPLVNLALALGFLRLSRDPSVCHWSADPGFSGLLKLGCLCSTCGALDPDIFEKSVSYDFGSWDLSDII